MNVLITGATGMVGKGVLMECLDHQDVKQVLSISRRPIGLKHPKLKELIHEDFSEFASVAGQLTGYDACFACMGVSSAGLKEEQYKRLTYDFTLSLARELLQINPEMTLTYVSGVGTDSTEKGRTMWARIKGKTENDLLNLGFRQAYMFRPGGIIPLRGIQPSSKLYRILIGNLKWLLKLMKKISPGSIVDTTQVGLAMINVARKGYSNKVLTPKDIQILAETS
jgi:uncharacterized protein YbjT (DUF2867 family)